MAAREPEQTPDAGHNADRRLQSRRNFLKWMIRAGYLTFAVAFALPALALKSLTQERQEIVEGDILVYATDLVTGAASGEPVIAAALEVQQAVQAFPQGKADNPQNLIILARVRPGDGPDALVAYSAICTHLGCTVLEDLTDEGMIACPCHASLFDASNEAIVVTGPAPRPLPSLPIQVLPDGVVAAVGGFEAPVGP